MKYIPRWGHMAIAVAAMLGGTPGANKITRRRVKETGGHRRPGYKRTEEDVIREQIAEDRRIRRAAKRHNDYLRCLANNPCLRRTA